MKSEGLIKKLFEYAGGHRYFIIGSWVLAGVSAVMALLPFYYIWRIIDEVIAVAPDYGRAVHIRSYGSFAVILSLLSMLVYIAALMCSHKAAFRVQTNMRLRAMEHIMKLPMGYIEREGSGKIRKTVMESSAATETYIAHMLPDKVVSVVTPVGILAAFLFFDWRIGLICLIPAVIAFLFIGNLMGEKLQSSMEQYQNALDDMSKEAVEYIRGIPVVKTFGQTIFSFKRFKDAIDRYEKWTIAYTLSMRAPMVGFTAAANGVFAALIACAFIFGRSGQSSGFLPGLLFYMIITPMLTVTLLKIAYSGESQMMVMDSLGRINAVLEKKPLKEPDRPKLPVGYGIEIKDVCFSYEDGSARALDGISISIKAGEHIALVGPSGGGKTTLACLAARFWDVDEGSISIGGVDIREIESTALMEMVSYVFQDSRLFKKSILENVRMGREDASDEEVMEALKKAQCMDIIEKLPDGVNTMIGKEGTYVSGGEAQRLSIARAFLKDAPILILDEATAFADPDNEQRIQAAFESLSQNKTVIMIAHRLSSVTGADKICVIEDGRVVQEGSHDELLKEDGRYAHMWDEYNKTISWKVVRAS